VALLLCLDRVLDALVVIHNRFEWMCDPAAVFQFAVVLHWIAPQSDDRAYAYSCARQVCRQTLAIAREDRLRAEAYVMMATAYFEEGRLADAEREFSSAVVADKSDPRSSLGLLAIACARRDSRAMYSCGAALVARHPGWICRTEIVGPLARDPDFEILRADGRRLRAIFGVLPARLSALDASLQREQVLVACSLLEGSDDVSTMSGPASTAQIEAALSETSSSLAEWMTSPSGTQFGLTTPSPSTRLGLRMSSNLRM
jgi:hypothetical protein